jgi:hypothetical protein
VKKRFVLIGGVSRSGTSLVRRVIGSHSRIAITPREFKFFSQLEDGASVAQILARESLKEWNTDFSGLHSLEPREAFVTALLRYAEETGKEIPGDKTPHYEFHYDLVRKWLQGYDLRFLQVVRNPLDVMASYKHARFRRERRGEAFNIAARCQEWQRSTFLGLARTYSDPRGYHLVKFEDLTSDPVGVTRRLCAFLGVAFEEERMLNLVDFALYDNTSFDPTSDRGHHGRAIRKLESRKHHLTDSEKTTVASLCGELAGALGYDADEFTHPSSEKVTGGLLSKVADIVKRVLANPGSTPRRPRRS